MTDLVQTLKVLTALFERLGLSYAVMGGFAVRVYAIPRPTYDLDFTIAIERTSLPRLFNAVKAVGCTVPAEYERGWTDQVGGMPVVKFCQYLQGKAIDIDVFLAENAFQEQLLARRRKEQIDGFATWFVSPEDLVLLKLISYRTRDIADIGDIFFTQGELDLAYLHDWATELRVADRLEAVLAENESN